MSDVSQGPGWWLASDGKWYPPHTAPQATLPPDASAHAPYANPAEVPGAQDPYAGTATQQPAAEPSAGPAAQQPAGEPYGGAAQPAVDPYAGQPAAYVPGGYQGQPYHPGYPPAGYAYPAATPQAEAPSGAPAAGGAAPERGGARWQPWAALAGIALILWGGGQGLVAWAQWHAVQAQLSAYGTITAGHIGTVLAAAGTGIAGIAVVAVALVMDRR